MNLKNLLKSMFTVYALVSLTSLTNLKSIFSLVLIVLVYLFYSKTKEEKNIWTILPSIIFGIFGVLTLFQVRIYESELAELSRWLLLLKAVAVFVGTFFFSQSTVTLLYDFFSKLKASTDSKMSGKTVFIISFIVLTLLYLLTWLNEYPGITSPDINSQIAQNLSGNYVNHHPYLHTLYIKLLMSFGKDINESLGIATFLQMIIHAGVFSLVNKKIFEMTRKPLLSLAVLAFYGLVSYHSYFAVTLLKDSAHAIVGILLILCILEWTEKKNILNSILLVLVSIAFELFRTNGYYAFLVLLFGAFLWMIIHKEKKLFVLLLVSFVLATLIKGPLYNILGIEGGSFAENLSIPLQQIAFSLNQGGTVTDAQIELLEKIVDVNQLRDSYEYLLSDPVKNLVNEFGNVDYLSDNKFAYLKLWMEIGLQNPILYIRAFVNQISGFIEPNLYSTSIFYGVNDNTLGIVSSAKLFNESTSELIHSLSLSQYKIPLLGALHYPAYYTWMMIVLFFYSLKEKKYTNALLITPFIGIWLTLLISCPYNLSFRYFYAVVAVMPLLIINTIYGKYEQ